MLEGMVPDAAQDSAISDQVTLDDGRVIFICCEGCEGPLRKDPDKWLANLAWHDGMPEKPAAKTE